MVTVFTGAFKREAMLNSSDASSIPCIHFSNEFYQNEEAQDFFHRSAGTVAIQHMGKDTGKIWKVQQVDHRCRPADRALRWSS